MNSMAVRAAAARSGLGGRAAIGLTVVLHAVACASSPEAARDRTPSMPIASSAPSGLSLAWRNAELRPIRRPTAVGDVVVGVIADDRKAFVVSIEPSTGRKLWQQRMSHSSIARGVSLDFLKVGEDRVAYLRLINEDSPFVHLVVADARTGREIARSPEAIFSSPPIVCANGKDICAISRAWYEEKHQYRLDVTSGEYIVEQDRLLRGTRFLDSTGLVDLGDRPGNTLVLLRNGDVQWLTRPAAVFPAGFSSDHGWKWNNYDDERVYVGTLYRESETRGHHVVWDRASSVTVGLSALTGEVLWRDTGSALHCELNTVDYHVRCRKRGTIWYNKNTRTSFGSQLDASVEGFDPVTGKTTWSLPVGSFASLDDTTLPAIVGPGQVLFYGSRGPEILDYAKGILRAPEPGATYWCRTRVKYEMAPAYRRGTANWTYTRRGGVHMSICDEHGRPATALPSIAATRSAGARVGDHVVIATRDGYLGFKASWPDEAMPVQPPARDDNDDSD
jgi:outer membrane protein assembly factor BamB